MPASRDELVTTLHAPRLESGDTRPVAMVHGMERALPGLRLEWSVSESGQLISLPQRDAWLMRPEPDYEGGLPLVCNGDETYPIALSGLESPALPTHDRQPLFNVHASMPLDERTAAAAPAVLEALSENARAHWGLAAPGPVMSVIADQICHSPRQPPHPPHGLPVIQMDWALRSPELPHCLGWLNYWSAAVARFIGFPDATRDAELLSRSRRTASGAWIVCLTNAPLDLNTPTHRQVLLRAYERFPGIGGRSSP